jgi:transposase InsO family protein
MAMGGIRASKKRRFVATTDSKHSLPVAENLLERAFNVEAPDQVWVSDITYVPTAEGWLYLAGVVDLGTRQVVGWSMSERLDKRLAVEALGMAYGRRRPAEGLLHHSDRGSQYASQEYQELLKGYGMLPSMSRKGNCWDNAPMESFFASLKKELVHRKRFATRQEARKALFEYIEVFYNRKRLHSSLGYKSPLQFFEDWRSSQNQIEPVIQDLPLGGLKTEGSSNSS